MRPASDPGQERRERRQREYQKHREKILARMKAAHVANPQPNRDRAKAWYEANKQQALARINARYAAKREELLQKGKKFRTDHPEAREAARVRANEYYHSNLETVRLKRKAYRDLHKERHAAVAKAWYEANKERCSELAKAYYQANKKEHLEYGRLYRTAHPEQHRADWQNYRARKKQAPGKFTDKDVARMHEMQLGLCYYCKCSITERYTVDHYIPLAKGGSNDATNLVLACLRCNYSKRHMMPDDFIAKRQRA